MSINNTLSIWLGTQFPQPNPELVSFNRTQSLDKKIKLNLKWEKCRYIPDTEKRLETLHNIFTQNT